MRRGARLFVVFGVITIFLAFYMIFYSFEYMTEEMAVYILANFIVWLGVGITEIAVGMLFEERLKAKS